jgi:hypothetical protein
VDEPLPVRLGWRNPDDDGQQLRLYAADIPAPRWWRDHPAGRTVEAALAERGAQEGTEFVLVPAEVWNALTSG